MRSALALLLAGVCGVNGYCQADMSRIESDAAAYARGRQPLGHCYNKVADYIDQSGYGGIPKGGFEKQIPSAYWAEAHDFADYLNKDGNAARLSLQNLGLDNPYKAPEGSIIVVRAGTPGTHNPTAGDIVVKGPGDDFYNDGMMGYGGSGVSQHRPHMAEAEGCVWVCRQLSCG